MKGAGVNVKNTSPPHSRQVAVVQMDRYHAVCAFYVSFDSKGASPTDLHMCRACSIEAYYLSEHFDGTILLLTLRLGGERSSMRRQPFGVPRFGITPNVLIGLLCRLESPLCPACALTPDNSDNMGGSRPHILLSWTTLIVKALSH